MSIDISNVILPVTITAGSSSVPKEEYVSFTETFSEEFKDKLPENLLLELVSCYKSMEGKSLSTIRKANKAIKDFCMFIIDRDIQTLNEFDIKDTFEFREYMKNRFKGTTWVTSYNSIRTCLSDQFPHLIWPSIRHTNTPTVGHSHTAYISILEAAKKEIDRIRNKIDKFTDDAKKGRVLTFDDIRESIGNNGKAKLTKEQIRQFTIDKDELDTEQLSRKYELDLSTVRNYKRKLSLGCVIKAKAEPLSFTQEDLIATINYYLPYFPVIGHSSNRLEKKFNVYKAPKGILLGEFDNEQKAIAFAKKYNGVVVQISNYSLSSQINPAQYLITGLNEKDTDVSKYISRFFSNVTELAEEYFLTKYDIICVLIYWACLTGWNLESIRSVTTYDLGFYFNKSNEMELFSPDHIIIKGYKKRGQKNEKEKEYIYISDKNDPYDLYCVLKDIFQLTKPYRRFLSGDENKCILVGLNKQFKLTMFGQSVSSAVYLLYNSSDLVKQFFKKHEIFNDEKHRFRLKTTNTMKIRTSHESMLEYKGVPISLRRLYMGHESIDTTMTPYGSDQVSISIRRERLRKNLEQLAQKAFKGQLLPYNQYKVYKSRNNVVQLFTHLENTVFVCKDRTAPTWIGHKKYLENGVCSSFEKCLFCEQCYVTEESLPFLFRWKRELKEWLNEAPADRSLEKILYLQAIEEVIDLCNKSIEIWSKALIEAEKKEMDPSFISPPFWTGG